MYTFVPLVWFVLSFELSGSFGFSSTGDDPAAGFPKTGFRLPLVGGFVLVFPAFLVGAPDAGLT